MQLTEALLGYLIISAPLYFLSYLVRKIIYKLNDHGSQKIGDRSE